MTNKHFVAALYSLGGKKGWPDVGWEKRPVTVVKTSANSSLAQGPLK